MSNTYDLKGKFAIVTGGATSIGGTAEEVAHPVAWLCSEASRFNTGAIFDMSGGAG